MTHHEPSIDPAVHSTGRDSRIDLLRGLALLVIASNHLPGNPSRLVTPVGWGFSDMVEVFLFLSGFVCGLSARKFQDNPQRFITKFSYRSWQLYLAYLLTGFATVLLVRWLQVAGLVDHIGETLLTGSLFEIARGLLLAESRVTHLCILLLYVQMLLWLPMLLIVCQFRAKWLFAMSLTIYSCSQLTALQLPEPWHYALYFNPFAWQFIFLAGTSLALLNRQDRNFILGKRLLIFICLGGLLTFTCLHGLNVRIPFELVTKANLGVLRVLHCFCLVVVTRALLPRQFPNNVRWICEPIFLCSRQSLATYCGGSVLSILLSAFLIPTNSTTLTWIGLNLTIWCLCIACASFVETCKKHSDTSVSNRSQTRDSTV